MPPGYHWKDYVGKCGRTQLAQELRNDASFQTVVCPFIRQYAVQEQKDVATSILQDVLSLFEGNPLPVEMDLIVGAVLEACGYSDLGGQFLKVAIASIILVALVSIFFGEK